MKEDKDEERKKSSSKSKKNKKKEEDDDESSSSSDDEDQGTLAAYNKSCFELIISVIYGFLNPTILQKIIEMFQYIRPEHASRHAGEPTKAIFMNGVRSDVLGFLTNQLSGLPKDTVWAMWDKITNMLANTYKEASERAKEIKEIIEGKKDSEYSAVEKEIIKKMFRRLATWTAVWSFFKQEVGEEHKTEAMKIGVDWWHFLNMWSYIHSLETEIGDEQKFNIKKAKKMDGSNNPKPWKTTFYFIKKRIGGRTYSADVVEDYSQNQKRGRGTSGFVPRGRSFGAPMMMHAIQQRQMFAQQQQQQAPILQAPLVSQNNTQQQGQNQTQQNTTQQNATQQAPNQQQNSTQQTQPAQPLQSQPFANPFQMQGQPMVHNHVMQQAPGMYQTGGIGGGHHVTSGYFDESAYGGGGNGFYQPHFGRGGRGFRGGRGGFRGGQGRGGFRQRW